MAGYQPKNRGNRSTNRVGATVSRRLRAADWNISPSARKYKADGMFVTGHGDSVTVLMDFGVATRWKTVLSSSASPTAADFRDRGCIWRPGPVPSSLSATEQQKAGHHEDQHPHEA